MGVYFSDAQQTRAAHLINFASLSNNTRRTLAGSTNNNELLLCDFGDYNKQESSSILVIVGFVHGKNDANNFCTLNFKYNGGYDGSTYVVSSGTSSDYPTMTYTATPSLNGSKHVLISGQILNHTGTGNQKMIATYRSADGGSDRPFPLVNPNASDDSAMENSMQGSRINIWEILL
tara:strand:- start:332 stop:859 length:528 start_codon:yes stop_codon:yes gene_type:complete